MTRAEETLAKVLVDRRERIIRENVDHLRRGEFATYLRNCQRIARLTTELQRRENLRRQGEWQV